MNVSTIPAPVAAELLGAGSFFGSCQIAAGGFESFLQSASQASTSYETPEMPTNTEGGMADMEGGIFGMLTGFVKNKDSNEVLKKLQEILGEEDGVKAFKIITDFLKEYVPLAQGGIANSKTDNTAPPETLAILHLMKFLDPEYIAETPIAKLKAELGSLLEEIKEILGFGQMAQPEMEATQPEIGMSQPKAEKAQPEIEIPQPKVETVQPKAEIAQPEMEIPQPKTEVVQPKSEIAQPEIEIPQLKTETVQPKAEIAQPEMEIPQPKTEVVQPKAEIAQPEIEIPQLKTETVQPEIEIPQPKTEAVQPKSEIAQPEIEMPQPKTKAVQPKAEIAQPETKMPQPKTEVEIAQPKMEMLKPKAKTTQTEDELPLIKIEDPRIVRLAIKLGIEPEDREEFYELIKSLLEQGVISLDDLDDKPDIEDVLVLFAPKNDEEKNNEDKNNEKSNEKKVAGFIIDTLKELWESIKNGDASKKQDFISLLKDITCAREFGKQLKESIDAEQKAEVLDKPLDSTSKKEEGFKDSELNIATLAKTKSREEKQVQPEVRAVWESSGLKIEVINPKTGEKLQSTQTAMPQNMQEKLQEFEVIKQVVARAKFITTPTGEQRLTIHLRPEHLGQLDLRITLNHGEMQIHARVESPTAQQALENHIGLLREGLEKQGITLERLEISIEQKDKQDAWSLGEKHERHEQKHGQKHNHRGRESHLAVSIANEKADTGRRLGYNTMEYLA